MSAARGGTARLIALFLLGALILLVLFARALPGGADGKSRSVFSVDGGGFRGAFLLTRLLGYDARGWTRAPGFLPGAEGEQGLLLLGAVPETPPGYEGTGTDGQAVGRRTRDPRHYRRFVEEGGTILAPFDRKMGTFLVDGLGLTRAGALELISDPSVGRLQARFGDGESLRLSVSGKKRFDPASVDSAFEVLATDQEGAPRLLRLSVGRGNLALFTGGGLLANTRLRRNDNALYFARMLEALDAKGGPVYFDEYALGGWIPDSPLALALSPGRRTFSLHLAAALLLLLWAAVWVGPFARDPAPLGGISPTSRAVGIAGLWARAGRWDHLARLLQLGVLRRLAPRAVGLAERVPGRPDRLEDVALFRLPEDAELERALRPLVVAREGTQGWAEAREVFSRTVDTEEGLERLGTELITWERRLGGRSRQDTNPSEKAHA